MGKAAHNAKGAATWHDLAGLRSLQPVQARWRRGGLSVSGCS